MSYQRVSTTARPSSGNKIIQVKVVLLGDQGVGKSSLALRFVRGEFSDSNEATIGAAFLTQMINVRNQTIKFDIWDTAGQERYHSLAPMYYRGAQAAIVAYDVTCVQSFERAMVWVQELRTQANPNILIVLAGNKADMASECRAVLTEDAKSFAEENKLMFAECSAKTGMAVNDIFNAVGSKLFNNPESKLQNSSMPHSSIRIQQIQQRENTKSTCC